MSNLSVSVSPLIDSGSVGNHIVQALVSELLIPVSTLPNPITVRVLDDQPFKQSPITHFTASVRLSFSTHTENICFLVLTLTHTAVVLGLPWLKQHNPHIDWHKKAPILVLARHRTYMWVRPLQKAPLLMLP